MEEIVDLSGLRDIHMPVKPSWWPLAIGWWYIIIAFFVLLLIGFIIFLYWYTRPKQYAHRELKAAYKSKMEVVLLAREISALLKRVALINFPRKKVASLSGEDWILFLKTKTLMKEDVLFFLSASVYMPENMEVKVTRERLYQEAYQGIKDLFKKEHHGRKSKKSE